MESEVSEDILDKKIEKLYRTNAVRSKDLSLDRKIETYVKKLRMEGKISNDEETSWSVYDFEQGKKRLSINENVIRQAASMIKPFIAVAYFHQVAAGKIKYGPKSKKMLGKMIEKSSNSATNWAIDMIGGLEEVQKILKSNYGDVFRDTQVVEKIPFGGKTYKNKASARDYSRFLYALRNDVLPGSEEIKGFMEKGYGSRIASAKNTHVLGKTGSTAHVCGVMGLVQAEGSDGKKHDYTVIGIIEKKNRPRNYWSWIRSRSASVKEVSKIINAHMDEVYKSN